MNRISSGYHDDAIEYKNKNFGAWKVNTFAVVVDQAGKAFEADSMALMVSLTPISGNFPISWPFDGSRSDAYLTSELQGESILRLTGH